MIFLIAIALEYVLRAYDHLGLGVLLSMIFGASVVHTHLSAVFSCGASPSILALFLIFLRQKHAATTCSVINRGERRHRSRRSPGKHHLSLSERCLGERERERG